MIHKKENLHKAEKFTVRKLKKEIEGLPDDAELIFGTGNLTFNRIRRRGDNLRQIEFNEVYEVLNDE